MAENTKLHGTRLPDGWCDHVRSAMLGVISLAQYAMAATRGWAVNSPIARLRLKAENDRLKQHVAFLTEEIRIKDARMGRIAPHKRPQYAPTERMAFSSFVPRGLGRRGKRPTRFWLRPPRSLRG